MLVDVEESKERTELPPQEVEGDSSFELNQP